MMARQEIYLKQRFSNWKRIKWFAIGALTMYLVSSGACDGCLPSKHYDTASLPTQHAGIEQIVDTYAPHHEQPRLYSGKTV